MRKIAFLALTAALLLAGASSARAQVSRTESGVVYYMPYTQLCIDVEYEEVTLHRGPFYQYSERYLATKNVITEDGIRYQVRSITLRSHTTADQDRAYVFVPLTQKVALTEKGLLYGIGVEMPEAKAQKDKAKPAREARESFISNEFAPLLEEQMLASSVSKMAEGTAKQIYHIREARMNWLSGDVDHMPADGQSLNTILKQLDRQEKQLTALFLGTEQRKTLHKTILLDPTDCQDTVAFRFSELSGPVEADDLSGEPYYLTVSTARQEYTEPNKKGAAPSALYYNLPGQMTATLTDGIRTLQEKTFPVGQFGISVAIPASTLKTAQAIRFDVKSGALIAIE